MEAETIPRPGGASIRHEEPGIPLAHYRQHGAGVWLTCLDCMNHREFELEAVIRRLVARGVGSAATGIKAVAAYVTEPCPRCGG
jgi:hypothetical protein